MARVRSFLAAMICFALVMAQTVTASETITYTYDALGRLVAVSTTGTAANNGQNVSTTFDPAGNRTNYTVTGVGGGGGGTPTVSIANTTNGAEPSTNGLLTVTQSATSASNTVISLAYAGTATNASDYTRPSSVTILAGQTSATVTLTVVDDTAVEGSETVIVTLSSVTAGTATIGSPGTATNTIADNDSGGGGSCTPIIPPTNAYTASSSYNSFAYSGLSGTGLGMRDGIYHTLTSMHGTNNEVSAWVKLDLGAAQAVGSVVVVPAPTTAPGGWGATYLNGALLQRSNDGTNWTNVTTISGAAENVQTVVAVNSTTRYLRLERLDNYLAVGDFFASASSCSGGGGGTPTVSIANTTNGSEPSTNGVLAVTQSATSASNTVISLAYAGTATNGSDYTRPSSVTILAGQTSATVSLTVVDDTAVEGNETVIVTLSSVTAGTATIGSPNSATNTIADNDSGGGGGGSCTVITPSAFTTSSSYSANFSGLSGTGAGMRDGNYALDSSVHGTNSGGNEFITMDLGSSQTVGSIVLVPNGQSGWGSSYLNGAQLQRSTDGTNWTTVTTVSGTTNGTETSISVGAAARYLRLLQPSSWLGVGDFKACSSGGGGGGGTPIVPQSYSASSNYGGYTALNGNGPGMRDAIYNTAASLHGTNSEASAWISMDLGSVQAVGSVKLAPAVGVAGWSAYYLNGATLERSNDGSNWTTVTTVTGTTDNIVSTFPVSASTRYLRIRKTSTYIAAGDFYAVQ